jgi:hypothetical protein
MNLEKVYHAGIEMSNNLYRGVYFALGASFAS